MRGAGRVDGDPLTFERGFEGLVRVVGLELGEAVEVEARRRCRGEAWRKEGERRKCCFRRLW